MKDRLKELLRENTSKAHTTAWSALIAREYLQARILEMLQRLGAFQSLAFLGGTALRFLYQLPRFSEDLDFSLKEPETAEDFSEEEVSRNEFVRLVDGVKRGFEAETYEVDIRSRREGVVQSAFIGFPGLLYELGLSGNRQQKVSIKIEIDTNPPEHAGTQTSLIRRHVLLNLLHYDKSSLFAGKLHALIQRPHVKGRDLYDLLWYLSDPNWPEPNLQLLHASLRQTGMDLNQDQVIAWRDIVASRLREVDWKRVVEDVSPFLERSEDIDLLTRDTLLSLLQKTQ